jgi:hypothetical protein
VEQGEKVSRVPLHSETGMKALNLRRAAYEDILILAWTD